MPPCTTAPRVPELRLTTTGNGSCPTPGYAARCEREDLADRYEGMRLLYVATTRARDHLVVSLHHHEGTKCHAAEIDRGRPRARSCRGARRRSSLSPAGPLRVAVQLRWDDEAGRDGDRTAAAPRPLVARPALDAIARTGPSPGGRGHRDRRGAATRAGPR